MSETGFCTSPQSFIIPLSYLLAEQLWGLWFIMLMVHTFQSQILSIEEEILYILIGDVYQFIGHCLISLDSCFR